MSENIAATEIKRAKIREQSSIADMEPLRSAVSQEIAFSLNIPQEKANAALTIIGAEARDRNLEPLYTCVEEIWNSGSLSVSTRQIFNSLEQKIKQGENPADLLPFDEPPNPTDTSNLIPEIMLVAILKDPDLRPILMDSVDEIAKAKSDSLLHEIDELAKEGKRKVLGLGIIGGGPLSSVFLTAVGPFVDNLVISEQSRLGEPWRSRLYVYVNSNVKGDAGKNPPLPLLGGGETPIVARNQQQAIHLGFLTDNSDLWVEGEAFVAGGKMGDASALNCLAYADNLLLGQKVIPEQTKLLPNGNKILVIQDVATGKIRQLEVDTSIFLTGPGREYLPIYETRTKDDYQKSMTQVDDYIENVRDQIKRGEPISLPSLPKILTGTSLEKLLRLWEVELKRNPNFYPLRELFDGQKRIGVVGGGDSGKNCNEFLGLNSPPSAYPVGFKENHTSARRDVYRFPPRKKMWPRYKETAIDSKTKKRNLKAASITLEGDKVRVVDIKAAKRDYDFVFVSLGYERQAIETKLSNIAKIPMGKVRDIEGEPVALGYEAGGIYIGGTAAGFNITDLPPRIQEIASLDTDKRSPLSLWIYAILAERLAYSAIYQRGISSDKVRDLYENNLSSTSSSRIMPRSVA